MKALTLGQYSSIFNGGDEMNIKFRYTRKSTLTVFVIIFLSWSVILPFNRPPSARYRCERPAFIAAEADDGQNLYIYQNFIQT
jgi:hypothetical protein